MQQEMNNTIRTTFTDVFIRMLKLNSDMNDAQQHLSNSDLIPQAWWHLMEEEAGEIGKEASKLARCFETEYAKEHGAVPHLFATRDSKEQIFEHLIQELLDFAVCLKYGMDISFPDLDIEKLLKYVEEYTQYKLDRNYGRLNGRECPHLDSPNKS